MHQHLQCLTSKYCTTLLVEGVRDSLSAKESLNNPQYQVRTLTRVSTYFTLNNSNTRPLVLCFSLENQEVRQCVF